MPAPLKKVDQQVFTHFAGTITHMTTAPRNFNHEAVHSSSFSCKVWSRNASSLFHAHREHCSTQCLLIKELTQAEVHGCLIHKQKRANGVQVSN